MSPALSFDPRSENSARGIGQDIVKGDREEIPKHEKNILSYEKDKIGKSKRRLWKKGPLKFHLLRLSMLNSGRFLKELKDVRSSLGVA